MTERRPLGEILLESGRVTHEDVDRVLEYQRTHGGFFGQALITLGIVTRAEIDWALASQFDLPFIFPNVDAVDREAAYLVKPDWALAHLAVPIVRAGRTLTVVVADPLRSEIMDELRAKTGFDVELALASAQRIRELIHAVYDAPKPQRGDDSSAIGMHELISEAIEQGAERFGVSIRGTHAVGWWRTRSDSRRVPLLEGWDVTLSDVMDPPPLDRMRQATEGRAEWDALLRRTGDVIALEAQAMTGAGGGELLFRPLRTPPPVPMTGDLRLPADIITELRMLCRGGNARVGFLASKGDIARALLPRLPVLAFGENVRAAHVNATGAAGPYYTLRATTDASFAETVAAYELEALTVDLHEREYPVHALLRAAPITFVLLHDVEERTAVGEWGVNWLLQATGDADNLSWDLHALRR
jgi:hypothetical protein